MFSYVNGNSACDKLLKQMNPTQQNQLVVTYSYATSENAIEMGFGKTGCYTVRNVIPCDNSRGYNLGDAVKGFFMKNEAIAFAKANGAFIADFTSAAS